MMSGVTSRAGGVRVVAGRAGGTSRLEVDAIFRRAPERDWYVPGEDVLLWVFTLKLDG